MKNRIEKSFLDSKKKLITFVTGGDPDIKLSLKLIKQLPKSGADLIEIGMPFSDPMADGPTIQLSSNRSISKGVDLENIFEICKEFRKSNDYTPIILMGYYNIIFHYGIKRFVNSCVKNGVDGLIIVDLQPEEDLSLSREIKKRNINLIRLITPTTNKERLKTILNNASGFLYYVTITGITGQHSANLKELKTSIKEIKKYTNLPIVSGFGIKNSKQIKEISSFCDGVVIGSSIIKIIEKNYLRNKAKIIPSIDNFVKNLKKGTNI